MDVIVEHEHPLVLIDLELEYLEKQDEYDDKYEDEYNDVNQQDALVIEEDFKRPCNRCGLEINQHHRFYYKCTESCDYYIHRFCGDLPPTLEHTSHTAHILTLVQRNRHWTCDICRNSREPQELRYRCSQCDFDVDMNCAGAVTADKRVIYHPSHRHPLQLILEPILCKCCICGKKHQGMFYHCITCSYFFIHTDCVALPSKLLIQNTTDGAFSHIHPLTLSYSFPIADQQEKSFPRCRVCDKYFDYNENLSIYKCDKCWFYTHLDCATARKEPFMSIFMTAGLGRTYKDFKDADHPDLLRLPFPDQTYNLLKHLFFKHSGSTNFECNLTHASHPHPLVLVADTQCHDPSSSSSETETETLSLCHNPMKEIELLCNGCLRPITAMPFYKCTNENQPCNFVLHEWCTRLPAQIQNHPGHPLHTLVLLPNASNKFFGVFKCNICNLPCNGFVYSCLQCEEYHIDVNCAFIPEKILHEAHPNHLLWIVQSKLGSNALLYSCRTCNFNLNPECALLLPKSIRHKFDKHPLNLSYLPIENHRNKYFCEICEEEFDPEFWFYHCNECAQSMHRACTPLILECEMADFDSSDYRRIYEYVNIKFGGIHNTEIHPHPLSFVQGTRNHGDCTECSSSLSYEMIFNCLQCEFAVDFECCKKLSSS